LFAVLLATLGRRPLPVEPGIPLVDEMEVLVAAAAKNRKVGQPLGPEALIRSMVDVETVRGVTELTPFVGPVESLPTPGTPFGAS